MGADGLNSTIRLQSAIHKINELSKNLTINLKFVFITGDITNTALKSQYDQVFSLLNTLSIDYYPIIGNHDQWSYNSTWETDKPTGDQLFAETFKKILTKSNIINYPNSTVWNPKENCQSWFQNYRIQINNTIFICLDWNSRHPAVAQLGYKGSMPTAELHDFTGGTLPWLNDQLEQLSQQQKSSSLLNIVLLQHHPLRAPWYIPGDIYAFSELKRLKIKSILDKYKKNLHFFGLFAGHFHMWSNGTAYDDWKTFIQWETEACKETKAFTLMTVNELDGSIINMEKYYGDL
ncbi:unnamed protein product [Didymodactylos carnosus]|uniref:Calcineurin-like phosphoesterase domain-containing protein n=2 Tax=Didymodactylos carnosus TaxID=1234261 RepID=A0A8S2D0P5_9BILA|nr:unnamed protein product [Didymodactylos carnosus]CAF3595779.1 unnamed protein product [Didymodactylos carnosus]